MFPEIARRLLATIPVMGVVAIAVFALLHATPGDPAVIIAGDYATGEDIARTSRQARPRPAVPHPGRPLAPARIVRGEPRHVDLLRPAGDHPHRPAGGDDGVGLTPVRDADQRRHRRAGGRAGGVAEGLLGRPVGDGPAPCPDSRCRPSGWGSSSCTCSPSLARRPVQGYSPITAGFWPFIRHLMLPALTLSLVYMGADREHQTRASVPDRARRGLHPDRVRQGVWPRGVLDRHALKSASLPMVTDHRGRLRAPDRWGGGDGERVRAARARPPHGGRDHLAATIR